MTADREAVGFGTCFAFEGFGFAVRSNFVSPKSHKRKCFAAIRSQLTVSVQEYNLVSDKDLRQVRARYSQIRAWAAFTGKACQTHFAINVRARQLTNLPN